MQSDHVVFGVDHQRDETVGADRRLCLLDAATGFVATPRWDGSGVVELALSATQAGAPAASGQVLPATGTRSASTVLVALGEWVTVAQSDQ